MFVYKLYLALSPWKHKVISIVSVFKVSNAFDSERRIEASFHSWANTEKSQSVCGSSQELLWVQRVTFSSLWWKVTHSKLHWSFPGNVTFKIMQIFTFSVIIYYLQKKMIDVWILRWFFWVPNFNLKTVL